MLSVALGVLVLIGWQFDIEFLKRIHPSLTPMNPMAALCFALLGAATWLLQPEPVRPWRRWLGGGLTSSVAVLALLKLCSLFPGGDFGIDHLIYRSLTTGPGIPESHMAINTAICFLALCISLLTVDVERRNGSRPGQYCAVFAMSIAFLVLVGYAFNIGTFNHLVTLIPMALHSASTFILLGLSVLFLRPETGLMILISSPTSGGVIMRRVFPVLAATPVLLGLVRLQLEALGPFKGSFGIDLMVATLLLIDVAVIWLGALYLDRLDRQRRQTADALRESQRTRDTLLSNMPGMAYRCLNDDKWTMVFVSEGCQALTGYTSCDLITRRSISFADLIVPEDRAEVQNTVQRSLQARQPFELVYRLRHADGEVRTVWEKGRGVFSEEGEVVAIEGLIADITEVKRDEESSRMLAAIVASTDDAIIGHDMAGHITSWNDGAVRLYGYTAQEMMGQTMQRLTLPDHAHEWADIMARCRSGERLTKLETIRQHADGHLVLVSKTVSPILDKEGRMVGVSSIAQDITERKQVEAELARLSKQNELILNCVSEGIIGTDAEGRAVFINPAAAQALGYDPDEIVGQDVRNLVYDRNLNGAPAPGEEGPFLPGPEGTTQSGPDEVFWRKDGTPVHVEFATSSIVSEGQVVGSVLNFRDITERKRIEAELHEAKDRALQASLAKSEFLATMSHEIRTPMNAIIGMAELLGDTPLSEEQRDFVRIFTRAGESLLSIINDILDLSKVEAGQFEMEAAEFSLDDLVEKSTEMLALRAHEKGLELACYVLPHVPQVLLGDSHRLRQILVNLVNNAVKFTEQGEVLVRLDWESVDERRGTLVATVTDTGIGIAPEKVPTLFDPFTQADSSTTRRYGGTGLGLAICRRLVELMGGRLWVDSRLGEGSTFGFAVPLEARADAAKKPQAKELDLGGVRTLVVDDNSTSRLILREILTSWGAQVLEANNGPAGLELLRQAEAEGALPSLILLDCRMPSMDGFEVAERIRSDLHSNQATILMLTSDNRRGDIQRSRSLGLAAYLVKPIRRQELREALAVALGQVPSAQSVLPPASQPAEAPVEQALKILLVDDSEDNRLLIQAHLKKTPHQLDCAENGAIGVERFQAGRYDLVFMDVQMPVMDGYEATRRIRAWEAEQGVAPTAIVALTANAMAEDLKMSMEAGCSSHLAKPVKRADLFKALALPAEQHA